MKTATCFLATLFVFVIAGNTFAEDFKLQLRYQKQTTEKSQNYHRLIRKEKWNPAETAIIVCDAWDYHHCLNATRRLNELAPRLNRVLNHARKQGALIIHAPSGCMAAYWEHRGRKRAIKTEPASNLPAEITKWCKEIPAEQAGVYPLDQADGGEDDDLQEHNVWAAKLKAMGRNPKHPWKKQTAVISIDSQKDYVTDKGDEVWNILEANRIKNVILTGVHANMCVLGRPFGLRQLVRNGKNVVLMRDMTDAMYNPKRKPFVSHFTGNDLIISHIEKFVCPTMTSDQFLGGKPFRFKADTRQHLAIVIAEIEYFTGNTLPKFAIEKLGHHFRISYVFADTEDRNLIPGLRVLNEADVALISVRRRVLPKKEMKIVRDFVAAGKPMIGIRTSSHAFNLRKKSPPKGYVDWVEFDHQVWGGHYHNHYGSHRKGEKKESTITITPGVKHPILNGIPAETKFSQGGTLYKTMPLAPGTTSLMRGHFEEYPAEPVAWTYLRDDGSRSFYTSMGHLDDFSNPIFTRLLQQGIFWAAGIEIKK